MEERLGRQRVMPAIEQWLRDLGLERHARVFVENDIDLDVLADLGEQDLERLGISLGDRKRMLKAMARLREGAAEASPPAVRAGLEIIEEVRELESRIVALDVPLAVRIGIHTGLVVVGDIGTGDHRDR